MDRFVEPKNPSDTPYSPGQSYVSERGLETSDNYAVSATDRDQNGSRSNLRSSDSRNEHQDFSRKGEIDSSVSSVRNQHQNTTRSFSQPDSVNSDSYKNNRVGERNTSAVPMTKQHQSAARTFSQTSESGHEAQGSYQEADTKNPMSSSTERYQQSPHVCSHTSARNESIRESGSLPKHDDYSNSRDRVASRQDDTKANRGDQSDKNRYHQRFREAARSEENKTRVSKLRFSDDELSYDAAVSRKLEKAQAQAERCQNRLHKAERILPSRKRLRMETSADPATGNPKKKLRFEKEVKDKSEALKGSAALRPVKGAANIAGGVIHRQIYKNEHENIGIEAAHRTELVGEAGMRYANRTRKLAPYNKVKRMQNKTVKAQAKAAYHKALADHPELKKKTLAKLKYKQKLKRKYAKAARDAQKAGKRAKNTAVTTEKIAKKVVQAVKNHPVAFLIIALLLLLIIFIMSAFSSCASIGAGTGGVLSASSYQADDYTISQAELTYTEWETDLRMQINDIENSHPDYDEYRYRIDAIEHDPYVLIGYLTAVYEDFDFSQAVSAMSDLFDSQYTLTLTEEVQRRKLTESRTDPTTHQQSPTEVEYDYRILNVRMEMTPLERVVSSRMDDEQKTTCEALIATKGCRQYVQNVFGDTNWLRYVTSDYGYRVHPISEEKDYHTGVDIGMSQGTPIRAGHNGTVTLADENGDYGLCVELEGETPEGKTLVTKYAHCSQVYVSAGQTVSAGDIIATVGSSGNSTGPHFHLEVLVDGDYLDPIFFVDTGDDSETRLP